MKQHAFWRKVLLLEADSSKAGSDKHRYLPIASSGWDHVAQ